MTGGGRTQHTTLSGLALTSLALRRLLLISIAAALFPCPDSFGFAGCGLDCLVSRMVDSRSAVRTDASAQERDAAHSNDLAKSVPRLCASANCLFALSIGRSVSVIRRIRFKVQFEDRRVCFVAADADRAAAFYGPHRFSTSVSLCGNVT
jgi:hypothetical protein